MPKKNRKQWTYSGVKRHRPDLSFADWLKICAKRQHYNESLYSVIAGFAGGEKK